MPPTPSERIWLVHPFRSGKFLAYSASNSDHGITWVIFTQRLSGDKLPPKGSSNSDGGFGASSTFRYTIAGGDARVLTYFTCLSRRLYSRSRDRNLSPRNMRSIIQQALLNSAESRSRILYPDQV